MDRVKLSEVAEVFLTNAVTLIGGMLFVGLRMLSIGNAGQEKRAEPLHTHYAEPDLDAVEA